MRFRLVCYMVICLQDLISAEHRIRMCDIACKSSEFVMVDPWEVFLSLHVEFLQ